MYLIERDAVRETPDIETSSENYARRFSGPAGEYLLLQQQKALLRVLGKAVFKSVLDVGGGHGQLAPIFIERGCKVTILSSDLVCYKKMEKVAKKSNINLVAGDLINLPFPDNSFDLVISVRLISHISDWKKLIAEFCRVSKKSVILDYPELKSLNCLTPLLFKVKKKIEGNTRTYHSFSKNMLDAEFNYHDYMISRRECQFFLPMFLHRFFNSPQFMQKTEEYCKKIGLTNSFGSPAIIRADKPS
jgi:ubiquinone/menaquinone biosynthesis C-methylase UbiE